MPEKRRKNSSADVMADADGASAAPAPTKDSKGRKFITRADVAKHSDRDDMWFVIEGKVYGVSKYLEDHPGGEEVLLDRAGADATEDFEDVGHSQQARDTLKKYELGELPDAGTCWRERKLTLMALAGLVGSSPALWTRKRG